ncbi:response regulator transcription factor [Cucumibacter marinus]|uniref:response regulator transcription factor n=1 Tax=Cucumibacter marinus TaxID=1121252 RepID=UPI00048CE582|nr:LuxR C-terminal-related transcriptional regulator [Cucumibacter marinus]
MIMRLTTYGLVLALGAFALQWIEYQHLSRTYSTQIVILVVAAGFLALGIWAGSRLTRPTPASTFERNDAALQALNISPRELAVLELIADGQSNKQIARSLGVSPNTVKSHSGRLFAKLEVERRTQAVARAKELRLIA